MPEHRKLDAFSRAGVGGCFYGLDVRQRSIPVLADGGGLGLSGTFPRSVVVAGAFPPPVNGMSRNIDIVATDLARATKVVRADLSVGQTARTLSYHLRRSYAAVRACFTILRNGGRNAPSLCIAADGQLGLIYTLACVMVARLTGHEIYVQHHSFSPINRLSYLMRLFVFFGGPYTCHVFLCGLMHRRFVARYPRARSYLTSSNARYTPPQPRRVGEIAPVIRIGLLSQLNNEKGLHRFLEVLLACQQKNLPVTGLLAGPLDESVDREKVITAQKIPGAHLKYLGPLYGADQKKFYDEIDVFVFPTIYVNEAQPNVLFEAMSHGAAIISNVRGCISEDVTPDCGLLIQRHDEFVTLAVTQLEEWCRFPEQLRQAQAASAARLTALHNAANVDYFHMLSQISGVRLEIPKQERSVSLNADTISA